MSKKPSKGKAHKKASAAPKSPAKARPSLDFSALDLSALDTINDGTALRVPFSQVYEDPNNPRTEFREEEITALAADIERNGVLQPIVTWPRDEQGRYKIRYGAKRRRAAERASSKTGDMTVPIVVNAAPNLDDYAQVAENFHRSDLSPMDFGRFVRRKLKEDGHSAAEVARRIGVDKSTITHHLALLDQPTPIAALYQSRRCTSAKNLYELGHLYAKYPAEVEAFLAADAEEVTRTGIRALASRLNGGRVAVRPSAATSDASLEIPPVGPSNGGAAAAVPYVSPHTPDEGREREQAPSVDPTRLRRPVLQATYIRERVTIQLHRKPPTAGQVFVSFGDGRADALTETAELTQWTLSEGAE